MHSPVELFSLGMLLVLAAGCYLAEAGPSAAAHRRDLAANGGGEQQGARALLASPGQEDRAAGLPVVGAVPFDRFPQRSDGRSELCQPCKGRCGGLARSWVLGGDLGGLPAGAELDAGAFVLCERLPRAPYGVCVPAAVPERFEFCGVNASDWQANIQAQYERLAMLRSPLYGTPAAAAAPIGRVAQSPGGAPDGARVQSKGRALSERHPRTTDLAARQSVRWLQRRRADRRQRPVPCDIWAAC